MLQHRKLARDFLLCSNRPLFLEVVYKSKTTPRQKEVLLRHLLDTKDCNLVADELSVSVETIKADLQKAYDLIYRYLLSTEYIPKPDTP